MILDKKIQGTLDQARGCLILYRDIPIDNLYKNGETLINNLNDVVDKLFDMSAQFKKD